MQRDFHYYCVGVLAKAAGFSSKDALTIAYASQYVDNATESDQINLKAKNDLKFDPVRTAHYGLEAYDWSVQKKVYISFHFLPPFSFKPPGYKFTFVTEPNSDFAKEVFQDACQEDEGTLRLCRIGIALHTFADTWAHQRFTGRKHEENDVESIYKHKGDEWDHLFFKNILLDLPPKIGHLQAGAFPDQPFLTWKYSGKTSKKPVERGNTKLFLEAAKTIYEMLLNVEKADPDNPKEWEEIEPKIKRLFSDPEEDVDKRCSKWEKTFKGLFGNSKFKYDKFQWRKKALKSKRKKDFDWDDFERSDFNSLVFSMKRGFFDSSWVNFHRAALLQRNFVLERLP